MLNSSRPKKTPVLAPQGVLRVPKPWNVGRAIAITKVERTVGLHLMDKGSHRATISSNCRRETQPRKAALADSCQSLGENTTSLSNRHMGSRGAMVSNPTASNKVTVNSPMDSRAMAPRSTEAILSRDTEADTEDLLRVGMADISRLRPSDKGLVPVEVRRWVWEEDYWVG